MSSQIEGTQSTLGDLLEHEAGVKKESHPYDVNELVNYVAAMNHGLDSARRSPTVAPAAQGDSPCSDVRGSRG
ncbi:MAG: Fic/DOC family N-terminal domain-containing protein [Vampirovibrionales bacterium]